MWAPLSVKYEFPEQLPLPETSPIADGNGDLVESHRLINLERSSLLMVKPEMATTLPGVNEPFECQEASPLLAQAFTGSKNLDDLPPSPPPLPWVSESTTVPEESEYRNRDPLVSDTRDYETPAPPEIRTKGTSPGCLKNTIPVSVYAGGEAQFNHMGVAYSISPTVTFSGTEHTTFKDVTDEIYKVLKLSEDLVSLNIQARYNAVPSGPFFFTLLAINDDKAWRLIYEMAVSGMNWRLIELYVQFVPNQACQNYNSNQTMPHNAPVQGSCSRPNPIPRNFPSKSSRTQQNTPMHAKPSQTKPKPPLPLISELMMLESECDNVNTVTQSPQTVHEMPDQLTKACQPDVSMIPIVSGTTDTGPTGDEQMEVSQIDTNKDDEVAISDRPPTEMAPPGSDTRDSETPAPLAMRILVTPSGKFAPDKQMRDEEDRKLSLVGELNHEKDQNQQAEVDHILVHKIETGNDSLLDSNCQEMALDKEIEQLGEEESLKGDPYNETIEAGLVETMELSLEIGEGIRLDPLNEMSNLESSNQDKLNDAIEEGEITDDAQDLDDESDLDKEVEPLIDDESEQNLVNTRSDEKLAIEEDVPGLEHENVASQSPGIDSSDEAHDLGKKRKRILSTERKAKKKKAYRIKRAKKLRADGVNRLRLPPPVKKEKEKKICKFYLQGKCQQGDQCKFSHDVTPVTKSKACSHFARGECLKGDECPYDHDLSKYPCHKFVSEGVCIRGANCKFSHNIQNTEGLSVQTKEPGEELSKKSNAEKPTNTSQKSLIAKCTPVDTSKHLNPCLNKSIEAPLKVPKGIHSLSFGADTKQEKLSDAKPTTKQKPHLMGQNLRNVPNKERENLVSEASAVSGSGELSEASKILQ